jgi:REP element-mobilizing transposase RayT
MDDVLRAMIAQAAEDARCKALAVERMKGRTSYELRIPWQAGYFAESISFADLERVAQYVRNQRLRHDASHPLETWGALPD